MPAIITDKLKHQLLNTLFTDISEATTRYYVGIGRSEAWNDAETVPTPTNSLREIRNFQLSAQSIKQVTDVSFVVPRYNWVSGTVYQSWDDNLSGIPTNAYYVLTEDNRVYLCLKQGRRSDTGAPVESVEKPSSTSSSPVKMADGYVWKFMYTVSNSAASKFLSANFMPVQRIQDSADTPGLTTIERAQAQIQEASVGGQILGIHITNPGSGYTSAPTITIIGNGTGAAATATVANGQIINIEMDSSVDSACVWGSGYDYASVSITGGGGTAGAARAIIGSDSGIGANPVADFKSASLMFNVKPSGTEGGDFIVSNQDFRQIAVIKRPKRYADSDYTANTGRMLRFMRVTSSGDAETFSRDAILTGATSGAKAILDDIDSDKMYAHQTEATGFTTFNEGETISGGGQSATLVSAGYDTDDDVFTNDDVARFSNDIIYIENRSPIERTNTQTEDIKAVITL